MFSQDPYTENVNVILHSILLILRVFGLHSLDAGTLKKSSKWYSYSIAIFVLHLAQSIYNSIRHFTLHSAKQTNTLKIIILFLFSDIQLTTSWLAMLINLTRYDQRARVLQILHEIDQHWSQINVRVFYRRNRYLYRLCFYSVLFFLLCLRELNLLMLERFSIMFPKLIIMWSAQSFIWVEMFYFVILLQIICEHVERVQFELTKFGKRGSTDLHALRIIANIRSLLKDVSAIQNNLYGPFIVFLTFMLSAHKMILFYFFISNNINYFKFGKKNNLQYTYIYFVMTALVLGALVHILLSSVVSLTRQVGKFYVIFLCYSVYLNIVHKWQVYWKDTVSVTNSKVTDNKIRNRTFANSVNRSQSTK